MTDFLNLKVGSPKRRVLVKEIKKEQVNISGKMSDKIVFTVFDKNTNRDFNISDVWVNDSKGKKIQGLWFTLINDGKELSPGSGLSKLLRYYQVETLQQLIGLEINVFPDANDFLVITACDIDETENKKTSLFE